MGKKPTDITGRKYGKLTVIGIAGKGKDGRILWDCLCECGNHIFAKYNALENGRVKSCGCLKAERIGNLNKTHGESGSRLWRVWVAMRRRCNNKNDKDYGGRGIRVCEEWDNNFSSFKEWAYEHGYDENAAFMQCTIDRIDVNGDYCPENCRWVDIKVQVNNSRHNHCVTYKDETHNLKQWSEILGVNYRLLVDRIDVLGWPIEDAFTIPIGKYTANQRKKAKEKEEYGASA